VLKSKRLLIVDDAPTNRKIVYKMLRGKFHNIDEAENGKVAVDKYIRAMEQNDPYDVIMMDFLMPVMNGLESTKLIRSAQQLNAPIMIGVTGNGLQTDIDMFMEAGVNNVMIKPLDMQLFVSYLQQQFSPSV
jgi:CheY-like chemotaxis protein